MLNQAHRIAPAERTPPGTLRATARRSAGIAGVVALMIALFLVVRGLDLSYWDFRNNAWAVTTLVLAGQSPAQASNLHELSKQIGQPLAGGIWGPNIVLLAIPLAALDWRSAAALWLILTIVALWAIINVTAAGSGRRHARHFGLLVLCMVFPPTLAVFELGQVTLVLTVVFLLMLGTLARGRAMLAGGLLTLELIKPQFLVLILPLCAIWAWRHGMGRKFAAGFLLAFVAHAMALYLIWPNWTGDYGSALLRNPQWDQPIMLSWLNANIRVELAWALWACAVMSALALVIGQSQRSLWKSSLWALALTPMLSPYAWSWDFVLCLPLVLFTLNRHDGSFKFTFVGFIAICLSAAAEHVLVTNVESAYLWMPPALLLLCAAAGWRASKMAVPA